MTITNSLAVLANSAPALVAGLTTNATAITTVTTTAINASTLSLQTGGTTALYIDGSQNVGIGTTSPAYKLDVNGTVRGRGDVYLGFVSGSQAGVWWSQSNYAVPAFQGLTSAGNVGDIVMQPGGGNLLVGTTSALGKFTSLAANGGAAIATNNTSGTANYYGALFYNNGSSTSLCGTISISGTTTAYNTSSDYRLKTNVTPLTTAQSGPIIDALKPSQFTWTTDNTTDVGFIAHEMQAVIPKAVTGEKDAVDAEGKPVYQQVAVSSPEIIAYLVAELQSVRSRLAGLESTVATQATEIATLKAKVGA